MGDDMLDCQVVVVGAGPAGATTAYHLARQGVDVLLLDQATFPRAKPCGGGLSPRAVALLDLDDQALAILIENAVTRATFSCAFQDPFTIDLDAPLVYLVDRERFDNFLVERAVRAGAGMIQGCRVTEVALAGRGVTVRAGDKSWSAQYVVGADGAASQVRRWLGFPRSRPAAVTLEARITGEMAYWQNTGIVIDYGFLPWGYGWVFPKSDYASLGVGCFRGRTGRQTLSLSSAFKSFAAYALAGVPEGVRPDLRPRGWTIPVGQRRQVWQKEKVLLVGDAAGLADSFTGEGLYAAMKSGQLAAETLIKVLRHGPQHLESYTAAVKEQVLAELLWAQVVERLFYPLAGYFHRYFLDHPQVCREALNVIYGRLTYREWVQRYAGRASWQHLVRRSLALGGR